MIESSTSCFYRIHGKNSRKVAFYLLTRQIHLTDNQCAARSSAALPSPIPPRCFAGTVMTAPLRSSLKLLVAESQGHPASSRTDPSSVGEEAGSTSIPSAMAVGRWRSVADAKMEELLATFDSSLVGGEEPARVAHSLLHEFMQWTRSSVKNFNGYVRGDVDRAAWSREKAVWVGLADLAAQDAPRDPAGVDRFMRIWLGVVHEATATGQSWLYAR